MMMNVSQQLKVLEVSEKCLILRLSVHLLNQTVISFY